MADHRKCGTCIYRCWLCGYYYCQYILVTGHVRGCSPVKCKKYKRGEPVGTIDDTTNIISEKSEKTARRRTGKMDILQDQAMDLYKAGKNDHEISRELHVTPGTVLEWRKRNNLAPNAIQGFEPALDKELAMSLYNKGMNDSEISMIAGCTRNAIYLWRRKNGLKANWAK